MPVAKKKVNTRFDKKVIKIKTQLGKEPMKVANAFSSEKTKRNALLMGKRIDLRQLAQLEDYANYMYADCLRKANNGEPNQMKRFLEAMAEKQREVLAQKQREDKLRSESQIKDSTKAQVESTGGFGKAKKLDEGLLRLARKGFVKPTKKGVAVAEGIALKLSREIRELERAPDINRDRLIKLKNARETLIDYMYGRLKRNHRLADYMETLK